MATHEDLEIYQISFQLCKKIHEITLKLPIHEKYELGSQLRRASQSIVFNIAEGYGRKNYKNELVKFITYSYASCKECESQIALLLTFYPNILSPELLQDYRALSVKINNYLHFVRKKWNL